jgi:serine protease Do
LLRVRRSKTGRSSVHRDEKDQHAKPGVIATLEQAQPTRKGPASIDHRAGKELNQKEIAMKPLSHIYLVVCLLFVLAASSACKSDKAVASSKAVTTLDGVKSATIQIVAEGSFVDPVEGLQLNVAGRGSGFIIDQSGLAVTNNHVVTGAALLKVYVGGEREPRNARIVAVSECSDLALIDIDGDGFPYLEWYPDPISAGLEVYTAGFPLGDPRYTLTRGIVSKERASGDTEWASMDYTIEHDATINPGNSGGPLVTKDGQVVGVNYAGFDSAHQYFAIARDEARKIIDHLREGKNVTSLGINGVATTILGEDIPGIWVSSVQSGSPAGIAGLKPGDFLFELEGLVLATDSTMADYCDILRSHDPDDTLSAMVFRLDTDQMLEGEFNGKKLEPVTPPTPEPSPTVPAPTPAPNPAGYTTIVDDSGAIGLKVPSSWTDVNGGAWTSDDKVIGAAISAAPDLDEFTGDDNKPGVFFGASQWLAGQYTTTTFLNRVKSDYPDCTYLHRTEYKGAQYTGEYDMWADCGSADSVIVHLAAVPASGAFLIYVDIQVDKADVAAADHILETMLVFGDLP